MPKQLYKVPLPEATTPDERDDLGTVLSEQGVLNGDALVEALSSESADLTLRGQYALGATYSELLATELEELADSSIGPLPLFTPGRDGAKAGYYEVDSAEVEPVHAGGREVWEWSLSLTKAGTTATHFQAVETSISQPDPGHPFGNDLDALVGLPAAARRVRALDAATNPTVRERPEPVATRAGAYGDIDVYDATAIGIDDPVLVYALDYADVAPTAVHVYDTQGRSEKYIESDDGRVRQWQSVFGTDHDPSADGAIVISNGLLRVRLDDGAGEPGTASLDAETWDASTDSWTAVDLPAFDADLDTDWRPVDVDLVRIGPARVRAQVGG